MKVLFVSQEMPPETAWGGIGTYVDVLSDALAAQGVEVHVLSAVDGQPESTRVQGKVTVHRFPLPELRRPGRYAPESWRRIVLPFSVVRLMRSLPVIPDVVECPEWMAEGLGLALRRTVPLVVRLHSSARQLFPFTRQGTQCLGLDGRLAARLEELSARRANVIVSTRSNLDEVAGWMRLDERAAHAIPYPVRMPSVAPMPSSGAPPRITFVGRLEPRKGPEILLRAAPAVLRSLPEARFVFVGRDAVAPGAPPSAAWLRGEAERLGVAHAVELTGQLDRDGVEQELRRATVCAFPSRWESFGNVVAEASAVGRPVVVSEIAPFQELVSDGVTGRIVPGADGDGWEAALLDVLADRDRARAMGAEGAKRIRAISEPSRVAELTRAAHEHAIERWRSRQHAGISRA
jgi:glycosyltransferase involved in cell wall biosynthesis